MDVRGSLNAEDNQEYITGEGSHSMVENDSFYAKAPPLAASTVGRSKSRRFLEEDTEMGSFMESLPKRGVARPGPGISPDLGLNSAAGDRAPPSYSGISYASLSGGDQLGVNGARKPGDEWNDFDTDGKSSLGILNVDDMDLSSNNMLNLDIPGEELLKGRGGPTTLEKTANVSKQSIPAENTSSRLLEGSSSSHCTIRDSKQDSHPRLLEGSSGSQDSKGTLTVDYHTLSAEGSSSTSHDSKDHPFARSKLGTVKKVASGPPKPDPLTSAIKQSLFGQLPIGEIAEEADTSVHNVELGDDDLHELDQDFGEMEYSVGEDSDKEEEGLKTPTNKQKSSTAAADSKLSSLYLRHGLMDSYDGEEEKSKKLTYLSKVALFDENGNDFNSGSELDTEDELEMARKGMRHEAAGEDSATEENTRPGLEGGCSDTVERQLPITQRQSAEGIVVSPVPGDGGGGGDGSSGSESDDGRQSGIGDNYQPASTHPNYAGMGGNHFLQSIRSQEQRIRPMGDDLLTEMRHSRFASSTGTTGLDNEDSRQDSRLQSRYLRPISPGDDLTPDNFNVDDFLSSPNQSEQQPMFDPGNRLEASGFNANDAKGNNSNPFGAMESSFGSFGLSGTPGGDASLPPDLGLSFDNQLHLSGGQNISGDAFERMMGSNRTSATSRSSSSGSQQKMGHKPGPSPTGSQENLPRMPERGSRGTSLGERTAASGSFGKSGEGHSLPTARSTSPVSGYSSEGSDQGGTMASRKMEQDEASVFKVPGIPAPKSGLKTSTIRPKTSATQKKQSLDPARMSSSRSPVNSEAASGLDLAYRISLTGKVEEQKEGLKRVPSFGGTSELDLTVPDSEFFGNSEALEMLENDQKEFEEENVFRQDDAMQDTGPASGSPNDSWAYRSLQSVARPSWMEPGDDEEYVRISVGTFMRGRTEALGTLEGDGRVPRPDFGMQITSPPKVSARPHGLVDIEESRTSGVGENSYGEPQRNPGAGVSDDTLTVEALSAENTIQDSVLDLEALGISNIDKTLKHDTSGLTPDDISMFFKTNKDPTKIVEGLNKLRDSKHQSKSAPKPDQSAVSKSVGMKPQNVTVNKPSLPSKSSHLPVRKGSNVNRSFDRVSDHSDMDKSCDTKQESNATRIDTALITAPVSDDVKLSDCVMGDPVHNLKEGSKGIQKSDESKLSVVNDKTNINDIDTQVKDNPFDNPLSSEVWTSPPRASLCPKTSGVLEKLQEFSFRFSTSKMDSERKNIASDLRTKFDEQALSESSRVRADIVECHKTDDYVGERDTPPPDGQANNGSKSSQNVQTSATSSKMGLNSFSDFGSRNVSDMGARPKRYDSGFDSVCTSQFRDSSVSQRDQLNSELKSTLRSRSLISRGSEISSISNMDSRDIDSSHSVIAHSHTQPSASAAGGSHIGFVPGHHVPDGTEYSHQSDYSHMDHKGMSRDDLEGTEDIGLADSRGFDAIRGTKSQISADELRSQIQKVQDMELRKEGYVPSEGGAVDISIQHGSQNLKSKQTKLQPSQSLSPGPKNRSSFARKTGFGDQGTDMNDEHKTVETQTGTNRHESWTQTSVVLRESIGLQPDETLQSRLENEGNHHSTFAQNQTENREHQGLGRVSDKPKLLSKDSLIQTDFAQEYLKRDFGMEVMEKIYSGEPRELTQHDITENQLNGRESIESRNNWTMLRPNETMETTYDDFRKDKLADLTRPSFYHRPPTACSTPILGNRDSQTSLTPSSMHTLPSTGYQSMLASERNVNPNKDRGPLCPVRAPGVLKFSEACVVGISKTEVLPLSNPTDRWLECILKVKSVEIDGRKATVESFPFEMRKKKIILDPHKTEQVEVLFLPNRPGAFVAEVLVFSQLFLRNEKDTIDGIPVSITFQAIAEKPKIVVSCEDDDGSGVLPFGELSWGMCKEKTISLKNHGLATVPIRLAIVSDGAWHCFSFEPEGRTSDVSIISGRQLPNQSRSVINLCLPGAGSPFNYHEIKVWCRPPDKHCDRAMAKQPPEHFSCKIDVELDIPYSKVSVCPPLRLEAMVGVHKLHIQSNLKKLHLSACPGKSRETGFKIYNAGNLELNLSFWFISHSDMFTVNPEAIMGLQPAEEALLKIKFTPKDVAEQRINSLLILMVQPQSLMFEVQVQGDVLARRRDMLEIMCDCTNMDFGGVVLGQTSLKRFRLINQEPIEVQMTLISKLDEIELFKSQDTSRRGAAVLDVLLQPEAIVPVYVLFAPTTMKPVRGKIVMKSEQSDRKYTVHVSGYGGVSKLCCSERSTESVSVKGFPCIGVRNLATERVKHFYVNNRGGRMATVKVTAFSDLSCTKVLPAGQVVIQPNDFVIDSQGTQKVEIVISMSPAQFSECCRGHDVGAALKFSYQDKIDWPKFHKSQLIVGLIETGRKQETRSAVRSLSMTAGNQNSTLQSGIPAKLSQTAPNAALGTDRTVHFPSMEAQTSDWSLVPEELVLYCPTGDREPEVDMFQICNRQDKDISFQVSWPADMITLRPGRGTIKARDRQKMIISASREVKQCLDQLPWTGSVTVQCGKDAKTLKVEVRRETVLPAERAPVIDDQSLVPVGTSHTSQSLGGANKLGSLEISRILVQFPCTKVGKTSEETLELKNTSKDTIRWIFSSFAAPYLKKKADNPKDLFRVSYKVFDFSHQFGKLNGYSTIQLKLQFMPRSMGTFCQYWDIQVTDNSTGSSHREESLRVHLTGEGQEVEENTALGPTVAVDDLVPRSRPQHQKLKLIPEILKYPCVNVGSTTLLKADIKNGYLEDVKIEVTEPRPPFYIRHHTIKVDKKRYLRFPVEFEPSRPGHFTDRVKFQSSKGETLVLQVEGQCK